MTSFQSSAAALVAALVVTNPAAATPTQFDQGYELGFDTGVVATACAFLSEGMITAEDFQGRIKYVLRTGKTDPAVFVEIMENSPNMKPCLEAYNAVF